MTRIADLLAAGPTISFEFFPPKNDEMERSLEKTLVELAPLHPSFVSVTYGALGSTKDRTRELVLRVNADSDFPAMPHLTCVGHTKADVVELLEVYRAGKIENVLALGGDPPADGSDAGGEFDYATQLVELVHEVDGFCVGVAAHPELHPRSSDRDSDRRHLAAKLAMADFGITQFFFEAEPYVRMVEELAALGCDKPIIPGVMATFVSVTVLRRMSGMNGTQIPADLSARLDAVDGDSEALAALGVERSTELCQELLDAGAPGLHLYALNRSASVTAVLKNLDLR
ncbi:MAG: methylenetetrahydrofolate reductase [Acidimicrobiales bacterium]